MPAPGPSPSVMTDHDSNVLLDLAEAAIRRRLAADPIAGPEPAGLPTSLRERGGVFVTLHVAGRLNGCVGSLECSEALGDSVAALAVQAAFHDPRLPQLQPADLCQLGIEISLLSTLVEVPARTRRELLRQLRPHEHGLVVRSGARMATFLPVVWQQLPEADRFVDRLLQKAGLPRDVWPGELVAQVFTTRTIDRQLG